MEHLISISDLRVQEMLAILKRAGELRKNPFRPIMKGKAMAMLFMKRSTRTRVSFEVAMSHLGGSALYLDHDRLQLGRGETIGDTARSLSQYVDFIMARVHSHRDIEELARHSSVPVINGLSDLLHPCQALSDIFTIHDKLGYLRDTRLVFLGDGGDNVAHSLLLACSKIGLNMTVACPRKLVPDKDILGQAKTFSESSGASIEVSHEPGKAVKDADILYTDTWVSMGEHPPASRKSALRPFQLNSALLRKAGNNALVMHCLPAHRGEEITDSVIDGEQSVVWEQAANRLHVQKGILSLLL